MISRAFEKIFPLFKVGKRGDVFELRKRVFIFYNEPIHFISEEDIISFLVGNYSKPPFKDDAFLQMSTLINDVLNIKPLSEEELKKENIKTFYTKQDIEELRLLKEII